MQTTAMNIDVGLLGALRFLRIALRLGALSLVTGDMNESKIVDHFGLRLRT